MSLIPTLFRDSFTDDLLRPRILDKAFFDAEFPSEFLVAMERFHSSSFIFFLQCIPYGRTVISTTRIGCSIDGIPTRRGNKRRCACNPEENKIVQKKIKEDFEVSITVQNFKPEEISVKMVENYITVEGKHEEKQD